MKLYQLTATELSQKLKTNEIKCIEIIESFIKRIQMCEKKVDSFISLNFEEAINQAKEIDKKIASGISLKSLEGIPIAIKDNIMIKNGITTAGSKMLENYKAIYDATVTKLIKEENMIVLGKTNLDEFAMGVSTENSYFKTSKNPFDISRVAGGSSGGSASCVSACQTPLSLGSDTGGSIRQPASYCSILGMKPTYGRVSRNGLIALGSSLDQIGPFARSTNDLASILNVICRYDKNDATSYKADNEDFTKYLNRDIKGMKIGIISNFVNNENLNPDMRQTILKSIELFKELGAKIVELNMPILEYAIETYYIIMSAEASSNLSRYDGIRYGDQNFKYENLEDLYIKTRSNGFGKEVKRRIMMGNFVLNAGFFDDYYKKAQQIREKIKIDMKNAFKNVDLLLLPTTPNIAFKTNSIKDVLELYMIDLFTVIANLSSNPAISVPTFKIKNQYGSIQLIADNFKEDKIIMASDNFEKIRGEIKYVDEIGGEL